jgi:serine/threonine protein kinase
MAEGSNGDSPRDADDRLIDTARRKALEDNRGSGSPAGKTTETARPETPTAAPKRVGHYHLKRVIASGGMGTVYEATQERPRRTVALKLMKHGIASRSALRRFEYESQILARLRHPGIAQVYEAGTHTPSPSQGEGWGEGQTGTMPFFAMEYIPNAKPITQYANEKKLGTRQRMELFAQVCEAIHHGHQKGIIHRDLKPSNILVDTMGQVKIIDFGVARSTDSDLAVTTLQTDIGQLIGTLQYMSPEQCEADPHDIDTRSDVYALGVVFYELLCSRLPYDVTRVAMHEATRIIREQEPTRLSMLNRMLRGDVETIALKALEKDRERRYQSATDFAQDIRHYLKNEAIIARPPSMMYQFRVLVRRNKALFSSTIIVFVILVGATVTSALQYLKAEAARSEALRQRTRATTSAEKAISGVRELAIQLQNPWGHAGGPAPRDRSEAEHLFREALAMRRELHGDEHVDVAESLHDLATCLRRKREYAEAERLFHEALVMRRRLLGDEDLHVAESLEQVAYMLHRREDYPQAEDAYRKALTIRKKVLGHEHPDVAESMQRFAGMLSSRGDDAEAEQLYRDVLAMRRKLLGDRHRKVFDSLLYLAGHLWKNGKHTEAEQLDREALAIATQFPNASQRNTWTRYLLLRLRLWACRQGKLQEAEALTKQAMMLPMSGPDDIEFILNRSSYGPCLIEHGRFAEAERELVANYEDINRLWGTDSSLYRHAKQRAIRQDTVKFLADLCERWEAIEPGKGYVVKAAEWRAKLLDNDIPH